MGQRTDLLELVRDEGPALFDFLVTSEGFLGPEMIEHGLAYHRVDFMIDVCFYAFHGRDPQVAIRLVAELGTDAPRLVSVTLDELCAWGGLDPAPRQPDLAPTPDAMSRHLAAQADALRRALPLLPLDRSRSVLIRAAQELRHRAAAPPAHEAG